MSFTAPEETKGARTSRGAAWLEMPSGDRQAVGASCSLGRSPSSELVLPGERVSRHHALLQTEGAAVFWLSDLGSVNGTSINGQRITKRSRLYHGDVIGIGPHRLTFHNPGGDARSRAEYSIADRTIGDVEVFPCWLMLVQLESPSRIAEPLRPTDVPNIVGSWLEHCRQSIEERGGSIHRYLEDGFLAFWRDQEAQRAAVAPALAGLCALQSAASPPFRLILHYGPVQIERPAGQQENLTGPTVNLLFRMDKLARGLKVPNLVSESAQCRLSAHLHFLEAGRHCLPGFEGEQRFYRLEPMGS